MHPYNAPCHAKAFALRPFLRRGATPMLLATRVSTFARVIMRFGGGEVFTGEVGVERYGVEK